MAATFLIVDFENVQALDLAKLPTSVRVLVFVGATQTKVPFQLVEQAQPLGARLQWVRVSGHGKNALDFHIVAHVGDLFAKEPSAEVMILSRDKGFDSIVESWTCRGHSCRRLEDVDAITVRPKPVLGEHAKQMLALLKKVDKSKRPRRRKTLEPYVQTHFVKLSAAEVKALVEQLFAQKLISESGRALTYDF